MGREAAPRSVSNTVDISIPLRSNPAKFADISLPRGKVVSVLQLLDSEGIQPSITRQTICKISLSNKKD